MSKQINAEILTIGRDADISLPESEGTVSRVHCELIIADEGYFISDMNSQNGLFLEENGRLVAIKQAWVNLEQTVVLGETRVTLAELLDIKNKNGLNSLPNNSSHPRYSTNKDMPIKKPEAISVKVGKRNEHISGRRVFCPHGHITLASLNECQHCGEKIE